MNKAPSKYWTYWYRSFVEDVLTCIIAQMDRHNGRKRQLRHPENVPNFRKWGDLTYCCKSEERNLWVPGHLGFRMPRTLWVLGLYIPSIPRRERSHLRMCLQSVPATTLLCQWFALLGWGRAPRAGNLFKGISKHNQLTLT